MIDKEIRFLGRRQWLLLAEEKAIKQVDRQEKNDKFHVLAMIEDRAKVRFLKA